MVPSRGRSVGFAGRGREWPSLSVVTTPRGESVSDCGLPHRLALECLGWREDGCAPILATLRRYGGEELLRLLAAQDSWDGVLVASLADEVGGGIVVASSASAAKAAMATSDLPILAILPGVRVEVGA
jgi:hypothetical protein